MCRQRRREEEEEEEEAFINSTLEKFALLQQQYNRKDID